MERNCHLIDLHKVIMAVILTAIKNQKNLHTLLDKPVPEAFEAPDTPVQNGYLFLLNRFSQRYAYSGNWSV